MTSKRERNKLRNELADLREKATDDATTTGGSRDRPVDVVWRDADPAERPEGMEWTADPDAAEDVLVFDFWEAQARCLNALENETDIVAFLGGYRSGKSVTGARWVLSHAIEIPGSRWLALGVSFQQASSTTYRTLFEQLPGERTHILTSGFTGPEESPLVADYNRQEHRLTLFNDSIITLGSADKWSRYAGDEYNGIWMDEPSHYSDLFDIREMMGSRLTSDRGPNTMFWSLTGNGYNDAWSILEQREDVNGDPINDRITVERASVLDNPYIDEAAKEQLRRRYGGTSRAEQALFGGFAAAQGLVYSSFSRDTHVLPHSVATNLVEEGWRMYGYDAGWNDPRVLLEIGKTPYDQLIVLDEFYRSGAHVSGAIEWLEGKNKPRGTIYAEHVPDEIEKFRQAGWDAKKANKDLDAGISEVRRRFEPDGNTEVDGADPGASTVLSPPSARLPHFGNGESQRRQDEQQSSNPSSQFGQIPGSSTSKRYGSRSDDTQTATANQAANTPTSSEPAQDSRVGLLISDRCEHLIRELLGYKEEHVGKSSAVDHCVDSLRYAVHTSSASGGPSGRPRVIRTDPW